MGWFIALAIVVLLAIMPLGVSVKYDSDGPLVRIIAGLVRLTVFPLKRKLDDKEKKSKPKKKKEPKQRKQTAKPAKASGGKITDFLPLVTVAFDFLRDFKWKLRVNRLELKVILAGGDPCDLAINYGKASAALGNLVPQLERFFVIKKRDMEIECDFEAGETLVIARVDITITLGRLISLGVRYGIRGLRTYLNIMKMRKGGNVK